MGKEGGDVVVFIAPIMCVFSAHVHFAVLWVDGGMEACCAGACRRAAITMMFDSAAEAQRIVADGADTGPSADGAPVGEGSVASVDTGSAIGQSCCEGC